MAGNEQRATSSFLKAAALGSTHRCRRKQSRNAAAKSGAVATAVRGLIGSSASPAAPRVRRDDAQAPKKLSDK